MRENAMNASAEVLLVSQVAAFVDMYRAAKALGDDTAQWTGRVEQLLIGSAMTVFDLDLAEARNWLAASIKMISATK